MYSVPWGRGVKKLSEMWLAVRSSVAFSSNYVFQYVVSIVAARLSSNTGLPSESVVARRPQRRRFGEYFMSERAIWLDDFACWYSGRILDSLIL
jgi:hypothetical protein